MNYFTRPNFVLDRRKLRSYVSGIPTQVLKFAKILPAGTKDQRKVKDSGLIAEHLQYTTQTVGPRN